MILMALQYPDAPGGVKADSVNRATIAEGRPAGYDWDKRCFSAKLSCTLI